MGGAKGSLLLNHFEAAELHAELGLLEYLCDVDWLLLRVVLVTIVAIFFVLQLELLTNQQSLLFLL